VCCVVLWTPPRVFSSLLPSLLPAERRRSWASGPPRGWLRAADHDRPSGRPEARLTKNLEAPFQLSGGAGSLHSYEGSWRSGSGTGEPDGIRERDPLNAILTGAWQGCSSSRSRGRRRVQWFTTFLHRLRLHDLAAHPLRRGGRPARQKCAGADGDRGPSAAGSRLRGRADRRPPWSQAAIRGRLCRFDARGPSPASFRSCSCTGLAGRR